MADDSHDDFPPGTFTLDFLNGTAPPEMPGFSVRLDEDVAEGAFVNLAMVAHSPEEFVLDFIRMLPGMPQGRVVSRVVLTPAHAQRLLGTLAENLERYERTFGEIRQPQPVSEEEAGGPSFGGFGSSPGGEA